MTKKTALEWFLEAIGYKQESDRTTIINIHPDCDITDLIKQAKQMEKEQIQKAFSDGQETPINHPTLPHYSREEYYNNTYSKRQDSPDTDDIK